MTHQEAVENYIASIEEKLKTGQAREHAYRPAFEALIHALDPTLKILNDPSRSEHGNPDFVFLRGDLTAGYVETKDVGADLDKTQKSEQLVRYLGYSNLILTDYLEFRFFRNGSRHGEPVRIGAIEDGKLVAASRAFGELSDALTDFLAGAPEPIKSGKRLAEIMGGKARRIRENVRQFLITASDKNAELVRVYDTIKRLLVHDLSYESFADMYAQTLVYGLFVARFHDETQGDFSRQEARDLVPASNQLLRHFFDHIVGPDFDKRLEYIVNELCEVFAHADVRDLMRQYYEQDLFGKTHEKPDPVIHFYEDFLKEYDPDLRKKLGAFYTPLPVVRFIVRAVDHLLESTFGLTQGLADVSKLPQGVHRVQILDPAVGTGTFISATIRRIYERLLKDGQKGRWPAYVHRDLLPRLHGFELMMAPYTIAHLKLTMAFKDTGFWNFHRRLGIYLTNSLEESTAHTELFSSFGFAESIADEAKEAAVIKNKTPIMVVVGNPPYAGESSNKGYTGHDVYKVEPGTSMKLKERNSKWINDDYVKFIRLAESFIEKTGEGIVAMITAHGYLDNPTFRGMRYHLMQTFGEIYVLDLHGNANKKEKAPDGGKDENVFAIKQGVAIFIGVKRADKRVDTLADVFRSDCFGTRRVKFERLNETDFGTVEWRTISPQAPNYEWVARDEKARNAYTAGFSVAELFPVSSVGIVTSRDAFVIDTDKDALAKRIQSFLASSTREEALSRFKLRETTKWKASQALKHQFDENNIARVSYRPFDTRYIYYHDDFIERERREVMKHFLAGENMALEACRQVIGQRWDHIFLTNKIVDDSYLSNRTRERGYVYPLYAYAEDGSRVPNLNKDIARKIEEAVGASNPQDIFDYVYAALHSPSYRVKYKELLKMDFPRVPYPKDRKQFDALATLGKELRELHLLESLKVRKYITSYDVEGSDVIEKITRKDDKVYINTEQYFGGVPETAWNFFIGGYQPAQKWLKDRTGRTLSNADIEHYQKIIAVLVETGRIMKEIDTIEIV